MNRALTIARATLLEAVRSRLTPLILSALLLAAPVSAWAGAEDAAARAWLSRVVPAEMLRVILPLVVIVAGAFLLRPAMRRGWALLPARRSEWFAGNALAGGVLLLAGTLLFGLGAAVAGVMFGQPLKVTAHPAMLHVERVHEGQPQRRDAGASVVLLDPELEEWLIATLPPGVEGNVRGTFEFTGVLTGHSAPALRSPVELTLLGGERPVVLNTHVEARHRVRFQGEAPGARYLMIRPADEALAVLTAGSRIRFVLGERGAVSALPTLLALAFGASLLCLCLVLAIRALSTAPTAALAGTLLLAALTLLPALAPAESMARDRRRDLEGVELERGWMETLQAELTALPQLFPDRYFDEYLTGHAVPPGAYRDGLIRTGAGILLLLPGALLFRRRQI